MGGKLLAKDAAQSLAFYVLAAAQGLDKAQVSLGMSLLPRGFAQDSVPLRLFLLAAAQGHPAAFNSVAQCHEHGHGVRKSRANAIDWYKRAQAAGWTEAAIALRKLTKKHKQ